MKFHVGRIAWPSCRGFLVEVPTFRERARVWSCFPPTVLTFVTFCCCLLELHKRTHVFIFCIPKSDQGWSFFFVSLSAVSLYEIPITPFSPANLFKLSSFVALWRGSPVFRWASRVLCGRPAISARKPTTFRRSDCRGENVEIRVKDEVHERSETKGLKDDWNLRDSSVPDHLQWQALS